MKRRPLCVIALGAATLCATLVLTPLPQPAELPPTGIDILDHHGHLLYQVIDPVRGAARPVPLEAIAPALQQATIAAEDKTFASNIGIDPVATLRAVRDDLTIRQVVSGGSTITQQLARLRYLQSDERSAQSYTRKATEAWLAIRMTAQQSKTQILEEYLNSVPYGNLAVGAEAAAWTYFDKPAADLSLAEAALLAGLPQSPSDYDPFTHWSSARARQIQVLDLMLRRGFIDTAQADSARAEPIQLNDRPFPLSAAHFVDYVRRLAPAGATRIQTTLDRDIQSLAERAARRQVARLADHDVSDAAVVVLDAHTGEVRAMVGGIDYFDSSQPDAQVNMAVAPRQTGSAFKPITYAAALESGQFSEASMLQDERTVFQTRRGEAYVPEDYDHQFHGDVPLRVALASSLNVPAVELESQLGVPRVIDFASQFELSKALADPDRFDLSLTLGAAEVPLLDLTAAYGAFATGGAYHPPVLFGDSPPSKRVMSKDTAWLIDDMLSDDAARGPGFGRNSVLNLPDQHVAVKTGTTSDFRDNWTVGFTPDVVVGVWVGNADNRPMRDVSGVSGAAPIWREVMDALLENAPAANFDRPTDLVRVALCADSVRLAAPDCPDQRLEWLAPSDMAALVVPSGQEYQPL